MMELVLGKKGFHSGQVMPRLLSKYAFESSYETEDASPMPREAVMADDPIYRDENFERFLSGTGSPPR